MIYTQTGSGVGPIVGYIATGDLSGRRINVFSYRKNIPVPTAIASQPTDSADNADAVAWSGNASYLAVATKDSASSSIKFFERSGSTFTAKTVPSNFASSGWPRAGVAISTNGEYVAAIGYLSIGTVSSARIWYNNAGTLTNLTSVGSFTNQPDACAVSSDGSYVAFLASTSPTFLRIKVRSGSGATATYSDMSLGSQPDSGFGNGMAFSPDDTYLAVGPPAGENKTIYKFNSGTSIYEQLASPFSGTLPDAQVLGCAFSAQGDFLAMATGQKTFFYERTGDTFTHVATTSGNEDGLQGNFHPSGNFYIAGQGQIFRKNSASSWTAQGSPVKAGRAAAFSPYV